MSHNIFRNRRDLGSIIDTYSLLSTDYRRDIPNKTVKLKSVQGSTSTEVSFSFIIDISASIYANWGDGSLSVISGTGTLQYLSHTYTIPNTTFNINIFGGLHSVKSFTTSYATVVIDDIKELSKFVNVNVLSLSSCKISGSLAYLPVNLTTIVMTDLVSGSSITGTLLSLPRTITSITLSSLLINLTGTISDLPSGLTILSLTSINATITGVLSDLPNTLITLLLSNITRLTVTGTISNLPRTLTSISLTTLANLTITGTFADLPSGLISLIIVDLSHMSGTGTFYDLPRTLTYFYFYTTNNFSMSGVISDLPRNLYYFYIYDATISTVTGTVADFPSTITTLCLYNISNFNITGSLNSLSSSCVEVRFVSVSGASLTGNLSNFSTSLARLYLISTTILLDSNIVINCPNLTSLNIYSIGNSIVSLNISACPKIGGGIYVYLYNNTSLNILTLPTLTTYAITTFNISNCALDQTSVDSIFNKLNVYYSAHTPTSNLTINTSGGTNSVPSNDGSNVDIVNLRAIFLAAGKIITINTN